MSWSSEDGHRACCDGCPSLCSGRGPSQDHNGLFRWSVARVAGKMTWMSGTLELGEVLGADEGIHVDDDYGDCERCCAEAGHILARSPYWNLNRNVDACIDRLATMSAIERGAACDSLTTTLNGAPPSLGYRPSRQQTRLSIQLFILVVRRHSQPGRDSSLAVIFA